MTLQESLFRTIQESNSRGTVTLCLAALLGPVALCGGHVAGTVNISLGHETSWVSDEVLAEAESIRESMGRALKNKLN